MKKLLSIFLSLAICISLSSCASISKKLTALKTERETPAPVPRMHSNAWWYKMYYTYWSHWEEEFIESLSSGNVQKQIRCSTEALYNLKKMKERLVEEKRKELEPLMAQLGDVTDDVVKKTITPGYLTVLKGSMEKHKRQVERQFKYSKVWKLIEPDKEPLPDQDYE